MKRIVLAVSVLLLVPSLWAAQASASSSDGFVDAGASQRVAAGETLALVGHVEGFAAAPAVSWSAPASCAIADASALSTTATCATGGIHAFTLTATDGASTATDEVRHVVSATGPRTLLFETEGTTLVGANSGLPVVPPGYDMDHGVEFRYNVTVPEGSQRLVVRLDWEYPEDRFSLVVYRGGARYEAEGTGTSTVVVEQPAAGRWFVEVRPVLAYLSPWTLKAHAETGSGLSATLPTLRVAERAGPVGAPARPEAFPSGGVAPYVVAWETDSSSRRFDDAAGAPFAGDAVWRAKVTDALGLEAVATTRVREAGSLARPLTVVAVIDGSYSPYHYDFLGSQHPWNVDADPANDIDFAAHPATLVATLPAVQPLPITIPGGPLVDVDELRTDTDAALWASMPSSSTDAANLVWFPGTKVIAAARFGATSGFASTNEAHGSASASVAAGNVHGSCPECVFVLLSGSSEQALRWASAQPWIDIITNSYGAGGPVQNGTMGNTRDNMYWYSDVAATKAASERGQTIVFSAGNGLANAFDVPMFTYWSSQKGPDWMVTVGAVSPGKEQTVLGAGKPVDISSIGDSYPSSGGATADGVGTHGGTSNAAPVTAGFFAKTLQKAREALGDSTVGNAGGVVASGAPIACGDAWSDCPLADGVLTRVELEDVIYANVLPSAAAPEEVVVFDVNKVLDGIIPIPFATVLSTPLAYYYQGHGTLTGRMHGDAEYEAEWTRFADALVGDVAPHARPAGETEWFVVDSKCRQKLWGAWSGGDYDGAEPALSPAFDPVASAFDAWCTALPPDTLLKARDEAGKLDL